LPPPFDNFYVGIEFANIQGITNLEIVQEAYTGNEDLPLAVDFYYDSAWHFHSTIYVTASKQTIPIFSPKSLVKKVRLRATVGIRFFLYEFRAFGYYTTGNLLSQTKDLSVDIVAYGKLEYTYSAPSETVLAIKTQSSINKSCPPFNAIFAGRLILITILPLKHPLFTMLP